MALRTIWQFSDWTAQSVNCILAEHTCYLLYYTESMELNKLFNYINTLFY